MSLVPGSVYANPNQPCFQPFGSGGGGGSNLVVDTIDVNQGGSITMGSSDVSSTILVFNKAVNGSTFSYFQMGDDTPIAPPSQTLRLADQTGYADGLAVGNVYSFGNGSLYNSNTTQLVLGNITGKLGLAAKDGTTGADTAFLQLDTSGTLATLTNIENVIVDISGNLVAQPKVQTGSFVSSGGSGNQVVTLSFPYPDSNYFVFPVMEDTSPAQMSAVVNSSSNFTVYWGNAGGGSHNIAWMTTAI
jgi:hypothetical protein